MKYKRKYIKPLVEFDSIDPETGQCTVIGSTPDYPWGDDKEVVNSKQSDFIFNEGLEEAGSGNMFGDAFAGDVSGNEFNF